MMPENHPDLPQADLRTLNPAETCAALKNVSWEHQAVVGTRL